MKNQLKSYLEKNSFKYLLLVFIFLFGFESVKAQELKSFLSSCGYGTLTGAGIGLASLVFEKKPNESYSNIARGASLGLYMGIGFGFMQLNQNKQSNSESLAWKPKPLRFAILPNDDGGIQTMLSFDFSL